MLKRSLPESLLLHHNYNNLYGTLGAASLLLGIASVAVLLFSDTPQEGLLFLFLFLGTFWLGLSLLMWLNDRRKIRRETRQIRALFEDGLWAEWRYSLDEWQAEISQRRTELAKRQRWGRRAPFISLIPALITAGCLLIPAFAEDASMPQSMRLFILGLAAFFFVLIILLSISGARRETRRWEQRLARAQQVSAPWVRLGKDCFYHEVDGSTPLWRMERITFAPLSRRLNFFLAYQGPRATGFESGSTTFILPSSLIVPESHVDEVPALMKRYRTEHQLKT